MFRRRLFRRLIQSRQLTNREEKKIFKVIDNLKTTNHKYNSGLEEIKNSFEGHFIIKEYLGRNVTIEETQKFIDASLYVLRVDVPMDNRYKSKDAELYEGMKDALMVVKQFLERLE